MYGHYSGLELSMHQDIHARIIWRYMHLPSVTLVGYQFGWNIPKHAATNGSGAASREFPGPSFWPYISLLSVAGANERAPKPILFDAQHEARSAVHLSQTRTVDLHLVVRCRTLS